MEDLVGKRILKFENLKYFLLGITLSFFIFTVSNLLFGQGYKDGMFIGDENTAFTVKIKTDNIEKLNMIETVLKKNAKDGFSIVVHNNSKSNSNALEYNFYTSNDYSDKIITYQEVEFSNTYEIKTGDNILFDPIPKQPIIVNNLDFKNMSENAIVMLFNFGEQKHNDIISNLKGDLNNHNILDVVSIEESVNHDSQNNYSNIYLLKEHMYIFLICSLISILIFKDINSNFKEISLMKIEGMSNLSIYFKFVLSKIILVTLLVVLGLSILTLKNYNLPIALVIPYYKYLFYHTALSILSLLVLTLLGYIIILKTKIQSSIKGYNQLETSIIGLSFLKIIVLIIIALMTTTYLKTLPESIEGFLNYNKSIEKYKDLYIINSSLNVDVDQVLEIERLKDSLSKENEGFSTVCLPEGDSANSMSDISVPIKNYSSIYYIVDSDKNQITIDPGRVLNDYDKENFRHYGFDNFPIITENLKTNDFIYCTRGRTPAYNEKLHYDDYEVIKIEVKNIYDHDVMPNFILFKANSKAEAIKVVDDIYDEFEENNQLIVESMEEDLKTSYDISRQFLIEAFINFSLIIAVLLVINNEIIDNFIAYDHEENISLHLIGKSKLYMMRKYLFSSFLILIIMLVIQLALYLMYGMKIEPFIFIVIIFLDIISIIYYTRKISFRKLRGL